MSQRNTDVTKPGRYLPCSRYIFHIRNGCILGQSGTNLCQAGTGYGLLGATQYYKNRDYIVSNDDVLKKVARIEREGQTVKTTVRNPGFRNGGLLGKLMPCVGGI